MSEVTSRSLLSIVAGAVVLVPSLCEAECAPRLSVAGDFGVVSLGAVQSELKWKAHRSSRCESDANCTYVDSTGTTYWISEGVIVRKKIEIHSTPAVRRLPFGLRRTDSVFDVTRKIEDALQYHFWFLTHANNSYGLTSDLCLRNANGQTYELFFVFNSKGQLLSMGARLEDEKD